MTEPRVMWQPTATEAAESNLGTYAAWLHRTRGLELAAYDDLWRWSVTEPAAFWASIWEHFELGAPVAPDRVLVEATMPGAVWFPDTGVNLAAHVLRPRADEEAVAIVTTGETGAAEELTWRELRRQVAALAATMRRLGVRPGDVVVGYLPNIAETITAFLAAATIGATWSGVGQDYAAQAATDRFAQLEPVLLVAADGHVFGGRRRDQREAVAQLAASLPTVRHVIGVTRLGVGPVGGPGSGWEELLPEVVTWAEAVATDAPFEPVATAFDDPLWVLFSSGTTGLPKGIVHSHGGVLVEHVKMMALHLDLRPSDRFTWYTSPSWVVWNCLVGALTCAGSVLCFDGAPQPTGPASLWGIVARHRVTVFGTSPGFLAASQDAGVRPAAEHDLAGLRIIGSTGSPLPARAYEYVATEVGGVPVFSMSGGTDIAGAFAMCAPTVPVWATEISVRGLGIALEAWSDAGQPLVGEVGELVVTAPMPSMPLRFWDDPDGSRYRAAYFDTFPGVWRHGDWITLTERGSVIVHGRSDSTLNRNGVRMGSADIYAAVESMEEIVEALVIGAEESDGGYWMPLFVVLAPGAELGHATAERIKDRIRGQASPRHVPDDVLAVRGIPHTRTGKKLEVPIKRMLQGADPAGLVDRSVVDDASLLDDFLVIARRRLELVAGSMTRS